MDIKVKITEILPGNKFKAVNESNVLFAALCSGTNKKERIFVGDNVYIEKVNDIFLLRKISERKNLVIRPPVANIDYLVLCISLKEPKADFLLLDKQIILAKKSGITPIICITKCDLLDEKSKDDLEYLVNVYSALDIQIVCSSSKKDIDYMKLFKFKKGKVYAFSGPSGVGKSTLTSRVLNDATVKIGSIARKTERGKNTTKHVKLYVLNNFSYIIDTPGFSSFDLLGIEKDELLSYYTEFAKVTCKYIDCKHISESDKECKVKELVKKGKIDKGRYERYVLLYNMLKQNDNFKYKK